MGFQLHFPKKLDIQPTSTGELIPDFKTINRHVSFGGNSKVWAPSLHLRSSHDRSRLFIDIGNHSNWLEKKRFPEKQTWNLKFFLWEKNGNTESLYKRYVFLNLALGKESRNFILRFSQVTGFLFRGFRISHIHNFAPWDWNSSLHYVTCFWRKNPFLSMYCTYIRNFNKGNSYQKANVGTPNLYHHVPTRLHRVYGATCREQTARDFPERTEIFPLTICQHPREIVFFF